eukprot:4888261-Pyramimonas_sp.AAC.1
MDSGSIFADLLGGGPRMRPAAAKAAPVGLLQPRRSPTAASVPVRPPLRPVAPWSASSKYPWRRFYRIGVL